METFTATPRRLSSPRLVVLALAGAVAIGWASNHWRPREDGPRPLYLAAIAESAALDGPQLTLHNPQPLPGGDRVVEVATLPREQVRGKVAFGFYRAEFALGTRAWIEVRMETDAIEPSADGSYLPITPPSGYAIAFDANQFALISYDAEGTPRQLPSRDINLIKLKLD